jgi:hypothetical protein
MMEEIEGNWTIKGNIPTAQFPLTSSNFPKTPLISFNFELKCLVP